MSVPFENWQKTKDELIKGLEGRPKKTISVFLPTEPRKPEVENGKAEEKGS